MLDLPSEGIINIDPKRQKTELANESNRFHLANKLGWKTKAVKQEDGQLDEPTLNIITTINRK